MYSKKYILEKIEEFNGHNPIYDKMLGSVCYLAYFNVGERGWFLYDVHDWYGHPHRVHTSVVKVVDYGSPGHVIVMTQNTRFIFRQIGAAVQYEAKD